jgi:hypothetical protein
VFPSPGLRPTTPQRAAPAEDIALSGRRQLAGLARHRRYSARVLERYPIGETPTVAVTVLRHDEAGSAQWSAAIALGAGDATIHVPGHYPGVLAERLTSAEQRFAPGARLGRDEYLDLTAIVRGDEQTLALSSTARSPVRVTVEVPRAELGDLALLLVHAQQLIDELRQGIGLVPDSVPDAI